MASSVVSVPVNFLKSAAFQPLITGPLLLILLQGPERLRQPIVDLLKGKLPTTIIVLKWLFGLGLASRVNTSLNTLALNRWYLRRPGAPWTFSSGGNDEIILITGGCSGFGLTQTKMFSSRAPGAKIVIIDRQDLPSELKSTPNLSYYKADLTDTSGLLDVCSTIKKEVGSPTVLINNAGMANPITTLLDLDYAALQRVFAVNTLSHIPLIQSFLPPMLAAKKGHIVTFASMASFVTVSGIADYCATKHAVLALHEGLTYELKERYPNGECINTTIVHPTWADTGLTKSWMKKLSTSTTREEVAGAVVGQVLAGKSGPLYVPKEMGNVLYARGLPVWVQEVLGRGLERSTRTD